MDAGYTIDDLSDRMISLSLYLHHPGGNEIELLVENPGFDWSSDKSWMDVLVKSLRLHVDESC